MAGKNGLLVDSLYQQIKDKIIKGQYPPGVHLVEADLTAEYGVSRVTLRETLRRLVADHLVISVPHKGIRVRQIDRKMFEDLTVVRAQLEGLATKLLAEREDADLSPLVEIYEQECELNRKLYWELEDSYLKAELNYRFHDTIAKLSGNEIVVTTLEQLSTYIYSFQYQFVNTPRTLFRESHNLHGAILKALQEHDGEAAFRLACDHVNDGMKFADYYFRG